MNAEKSNILSLDQFLHNNFTICVLQSIDENIYYDEVIILYKNRKIGFKNQTILTAIPTKNDEEIEFSFLNKDLERKIFIYNGETNTYSKINEEVSLIAKAEKIFMDDDNLVLVHETK